MVPIPMRRRSPCALPSLLLTLLLAAQVHAQSPAPTRPDPLDPRAHVPSVRYESSFAQFRRIGDDKPVAWREANDAVARIGGWRVYAREAQQPDPTAAEKPAAPSQAPASTPALAAPPMPAGHSGHKH
ncbi:hypothetical protein [Methylibium sp. Root1272]|uniref:hypothetical protein n=1 Tax=Methylibium sp. Root1272 TaxID=1736441 RepID=UPI000A810D6B|nr:hypothetical protein [Methylibium sp. Root1272]